MRNSLAIILMMAFVMSFVCIDVVGENQGKNQKMNDPSEQNTLLKLDQAISKTASKKGILEAFLPYTANDSLLLPLIGHPVEGTKNSEALLKNPKMKQQTLSWEPLFARVSKAGDIGYTHGKYTRSDSKDTKNKNDNGYYVTIWKKNSDGKWKIAVSQGLIFMENLNPNPVETKINPQTMDPETKAVVETEISFSVYSVKHGAAKAFSQFSADDGIALNFSGPPNNKTYFASAAAEAEKDDGSNGKNQLKWTPLYSFVSSSGDMAYNYGCYTFTNMSKDGRTNESYGYFITVWKKQPDNSWKFLIDGGNRSPKVEKKIEIK